MIEEYTTPDQLRRLVSAFLGVVLVLSVLGLFLVIVVPGLRSALVPAPAPDVVVAGSRTGWLDPTDYPATRATVIPPVDPKAVLAPSPALLARGGELYARHCASCHGEQGRGDGPASVSLTPRPRDFTAAEGWRNGPTITGVFATLEHGIAGSGMNAFDYLPVADRMALIHRVRAFGASARPADDPARLEALSRRLGSAGERVPARIPVKQAMQALVREAAAVRVPFAEAGARDSLAGRAWARATSDPERSTLALHATGAWRRDARTLAAVALAGVPANGFSTRAALLSNEEWHALHEALTRSIPAGR